MFVLIARERKMFVVQAKQNTLLCLFLQFDVIVKFTDTV